MEVIIGFTLRSTADAKYFKRPSVKIAGPKDSLDAY
jgi:hypothetical protein